MTNGAGWLSAASLVRRRKTEAHKCTHDFCSCAVWTMSRSVCLIFCFVCFFCVFYEQTNFEPCYYHYAFHFFLGCALDHLHFLLQHHHYHRHHLYYLHCRYHYRLLTLLDHYQSFPVAQREDQTRHSTHQMGVVCCLSHRRS